MMVVVARAAILLIVGGSVQPRRDSAAGAVSPAFQRLFAALAGAVARRRKGLSRETDHRYGPATVHIWSRALAYVVIAALPIIGAVCSCRRSNRVTALWP